ncbi:MAG: hypothetical protein M3Z37_05495 [Candidatus Eremiobacteraeota bacterium]|nr:hypothetical protein [Candidatus Eremiobacteraeota bacterium]
MNILVVLAIAVPLLSIAPYQRVPICDLTRVSVGDRIEVVGYFSHATNEIDGDLQVYLIDHHGQFVVVEAPRRFRDMKFFVRSLHLHRGELVVARGVLTRQADKPTKFYLEGWMEIQPVEMVARYSGTLPDDLHYTRVVHHMFGKAHVSQL